MSYKWNWITTYHPSSLIKANEPQKNPVEELVEQARARLEFYRQLQAKK